MEHKAEGVAANSSMLDGDSSTTMKYVSLTCFQV